MCAKLNSLRKHIEFEETNVESADSDCEASHDTTTVGTLIFAEHMCKD